MVQHIEPMKRGGSLNKLVYPLGIRRYGVPVFDPIFPDTFYHLFHYELDAAGTLAENDNPVHCEDA
ncbi:hypothetical protein, partial [Providencia rettgeri]|uniref:hypothetical protein n=1 Tax=Providencia rettgeri TaxID=587 RepID=UPI00301604E4